MCFTLPSLKITKFVWVGIFFMDYYFWDMDVCHLHLYSFPYYPNIDSLLQCNNYVIVLGRRYHTVIN